MTFLGKIKPHLISKDLLIQETVLYALHDYPNVPEEWTIELLKEAFTNVQKQYSILIYIDHMKFTEEAVEILLENIPKMDKSKIHLGIRLLSEIEPKLAFKYKEELSRYISADEWSFYERVVNGSKEEVYSEYKEIVHALEHGKYHEQSLYSKAKKLAKSIVQHGWITEDEIERIIQKERKEEWFSHEGILAVYMIGLLKLESYIPYLATLLTRDEDILLEEVSSTLIGFQSDEVVQAVGPYLKKSESVIFASSIIENIKSDLAVQALIEAYRCSGELDEQDLLIEALCHQFSEKGLPVVSDHMKKDYTSGLVDIELAAYSYYSILGESHPELMDWKLAALENVLDVKHPSKQDASLQSGTILKEPKVGRNDPCPCGSGKKYKKCCGK
ncbi:SEC-C metal-binding domain-containing protein [Neobacillus drentensis]|uniref:SEC-C metal-binding domain-containing protein n=1 Tax=Neobacillus drentensis TaxID=220684 RepID=UPI002FFFF2B8